MAFDLSTWPVVQMDEVRRSFQQIPTSAYPELGKYTRSDIHSGLAGQGGLYLASDMAKKLALNRDSLVLDLGCGEGSTSIFLAETYGVKVYAVDEEASSSLLERASAAGVADLVTPVRADARKLPFPQEKFDAIFSMNAFFYFGTDDQYPTYLLRYLKNNGELVIGSPCYRDEINENTEKELLLEFPACLAVHSPRWWENHFVRTRCAEVMSSEPHPFGVEFWYDRVRFLLESQAPAEMNEGQRNMIFAMIRALNHDREGLITHFILHAKKILPNQSTDPTP
jgi:SAM-dependent methyltransferase